MRVDKDILVSALLAKHRKLSDLAEFLHINPSTLSRKISQYRFTAKEISDIAKWLDLTPATKEQIFFAN